MLQNRISHETKHPYFKTTSPLYTLKKYTSIDPKQPSSICTCPFHRQKMDAVENTKSAWNRHRQRPRERWFRRGPALHKDTAWPSSIQIKIRTQESVNKTETNYTNTENPDKGIKQKTGCKRTATLRQTRALPSTGDKRTAGKGTAKPYTKTSTKADKSRHRTNKGAKTKERTQS